MALHYQNPNYFFTQQPIFNQFQYQNFHFQDPNDIFAPPPSDTELFSFDDPLPPTLFHFDDPSFHPFNLQPFDHFNHDHHDFITPNYSPFQDVSFPPPMLLPTEYILPYGEDYHTQFMSFPKKQKVEFSVPSCFNPEIFIPPEFNHDFRFDQGVLTKQELFNPINELRFRFDNGGLAEFNEGYGENVHDDYNKGSKVKVLSPQSRAAKERRRKITMKTSELGKLVPGGTKMNTAQMFEAASKYVNFMKAQLGILQSIQALLKLQDDVVEDTKLKNLSILSSKIVQEKLLAKEMCIVPMELLPLLEEHCDTETKPLISQYITSLH